MWRPTFLQIRSAVLFAGGMAGVAYVTLLDNTDRPTLLILFAAMLGLPLFLHSDERRPPPLPPPELRGPLPPSPSLPAPAEVDPPQ